MDAERFDNLIRALPAIASRRRLLAAALGGVLGLLGIAQLETDAKKSCKGLKGKKKKKCLQKLKGAECQKDADCPDHSQACQNGRCQRVCPPGACPGCNACLVRFAANGSRSQRCAGSVEVPSPLQVCDTEADCPPAEPLCILFDIATCTEGPCGICVVSTGSCDEPECQNDGDCLDRAESCQSGQCQPVCPTGACPGCNFCAVSFEANGDRSQVCADSFTLTDQVTCSTAANCSQVDPCIRLPAVFCDQPPCDLCVLAVDTCP